MKFYKSSVILNEPNYLFCRTLFDWRCKFQVSLWRILGLKILAKKLEGSFFPKYWFVILETCPCTSISFHLFVLFSTSLWIFLFLCVFTRVPALCLIIIMKSGGVVRCMLSSFWLDKIPPWVLPTIHLSLSLTHAVCSRIHTHSCTHAFTNF